MSEDWEIYCRTCDDTHGFDDANHREDLMWFLIAHAKEIAAVDPVVNGGEGIELKCFYGCLRPEWFAKHLGHDLVPRSEYGYFGKPPSEEKNVDLGMIPEVAHKVRSEI